jgi:hypothetical protein
MKTAKGGGDDRNKLIAVGAFVILAAGVLYFELSDSGPSSTPAPVVVTTGPVKSSGNTAGNAAKVVGATSAKLDPTLHMDAMLVSEAVDYAGNGRNIFSMNSAPPVVIPNPVASARLAEAAKPAPIVPCPPNCPPPPPPPPIPLKFFGTVASAKGVRRAFVMQEDNIQLASAGDIVFRRYRVISIEAKTIQVEDMQNNNRQTLPLLVN